jgi:hypothetical protein
MHAANASETMIIPTLARLKAEMQLTESSQYYSLFDPVNVNNISVNDIMINYLEASSCDHNGPQSE